MEKNKNCINGNKWFDSPSIWGLLTVAMQHAPCLKKNNNNKIYITKLLSVQHDL